MTDGTEVIYAEGFDAALIGLTEWQPGRQRLAVYDYMQCARILMERDGMSEEDAVEFLDFNVVGSWMGDCTPVFVIID